MTSRTVALVDKIIVWTIGLISGSLAHIYTHNLHGRDLYVNQVCFAASSTCYDFPTHFKSCSVLSIVTLALVGSIHPRVLIVDSQH
jgi:hypothetical protein